MTVPRPLCISRAIRSSKIQDLPAPPAAAVALVALSPQPVRHPHFAKRYRLRIFGTSSVVRSFFLPLSACPSASESLSSSLRFKFKIYHRTPISKYNLYDPFCRGLVPLVHAIHCAVHPYPRTASRPLISTGGLSIAGPYFTSCAFRGTIAAESSEDIYSSGSRDLSTPPATAVALVGSARRTADNR